MSDKIETLQAELARIERQLNQLAIPAAPQSNQHQVNAQAERLDTVEQELQRLMLTLNDRNRAISDAAVKAVEARIAAAVKSATSAQIAAVGEVLGQVRTELKGLVANRDAEIRKELEAHGELAGNRISESQNILRDWAASLAPTFI
jgi:DNA repair exonuclease SbcCD ATPase subunit